MEKKEGIIIVITILLMSLIVSYTQEYFDNNLFLINLLFSAVIVLVAVFAKKITASILDIEIEIKIWEFKRWWITRTSELKKPVPIALILPILLSFLSGGVIKFLAFLQFDSKALPSKATKKYGMRRFSDVLDWDEALICFYSLIATLILALFMSFLGYNPYAKITIIYALSNILPISSLDGTKMFFGSRPLYIFAVILFAIAGLLVYF